VNKPRTLRTLKEKLIPLNYYNIVIKMIIINLKRASRSAEREPKTDGRKYKLECIEIITGHYITVQSVLTIYFCFN
jgi:hypothetical protein